MWFKRLTDKFSSRCKRRQREIPEGASSWLKLLPCPGSSLPPTWPTFFAFWLVPPAHAPLFQPQRPVRGDNVPDGLEPRIGFHPGAGKAAAVGQFIPAPQTLLPLCSCAATPAPFIFALPTAEGQQPAQSGKTAGDLTWLYQQRRESLFSSELVSA